jgi:hypothetical protein
MDELHSGLLAAAKSVVTGSGTAKAIDYTVNQWPALQHYADSGALPISNGAASERESIPNLARPRYMPCSPGPPMPARLPREKETDWQGREYT